MVRQIKFKNKIRHRIQWLIENFIVGTRVKSSVVCLGTSYLEIRRTKICFKYAFYRSSMFK